MFSLIFLIVLNCCFDGVVKRKKTWGCFCGFVVVVIMINLWNHSECHFHWRWLVTKEIYYQRKYPSHKLKTNREMKLHFTTWTVMNVNEDCGYPQFLRMPKLDNYILNDMLSIQCRLTPP